MAFLIVKSGPHAGERIEILGELVVGRENADLNIDDPELSRRHLAVRPLDGGVEVEDLGSTNGTVVDGARIDAPVTLSASASITIGETLLEVEIVVPEPAEDPGATRLRERPPAPDATVLRSTPTAPPPDATQVGAAPPPPPPPPPPSPPPPPPPAPAAPARAAAAPDQPFGAFEPAAPRRRRRGSATTLVTPALLVVLVIVADAVALVVYFGAR